MDLGIGGKVALVMGSSRGIGRGIAEALAQDGARVAISGRSQQRLDATAAEVNGAVPFVADTNDLDGLAELPRRVAEELGPIEILVTNTGGPPPGTSLDAPVGEWEKSYRSLVLAPRILIEEVLPGMRERGWGRIVNVASTSIKEPIPWLALSNIHRAGALAFFKTLAREVAADGVTVNTIATGRFATERMVELAGSMEAVEQGAREEVPAGRLGQPREFGDLVAFLSSQRAAYLTGVTLPLDGGLLRSS